MALRACSRSKASSIFGIILADFRFFLRGQYTKFDINPAKRIEKSAQKNPKIDRSLDPEQAPRITGNLLSRWKSRGSKEWKGVFRFLFASFFVISLACFLQFREVRVDHLELNTIAEKFVLAQVGFEFPDAEATRLLKEESLRDLGRVYQFNDDEILKVEKKIQQDLVANPEWRHILAEVTFEELLRANEKVRDILLNVGIADARGVSKIKQLFQDYQMVVYVPGELTGILPIEVWRQVGEQTSPAFNYIREKYSSYPWALEEDLTTQNAVRQMIKDSIPLKMTKVEPGSRIINAGEKVTLRHLDMLQGMKKALSEQRFMMTPLSVLGNLALSMILTLMGIFYFRTTFPHFLQSFSKMGLIGTIILLTLSIAKVSEYLVINKSVGDLCRYPIFVLFATLTLSILIDKGVAIIVSGFIAMVLTISLAIEYHHFLIINLASSVIAVLLIHTVRKRTEIFAVCAKVWLMTLPLLIATNLLENSLWDYRLLSDFATTFICLAATGIIVVAILPLLEAAFGVVTDMTLMETGDPNHPLLRRLSLEAPGTYQHSLGVAALAEEAALAIHANGIFCRVAALYHDIGKLAQPHYFIENQFTGFNMHQLLTPLESAQLIIAHVAEGVKLAQQHELPESLIDIIREHHGTGLVYYFFHAQMEQSRGRAIHLEESYFRYPGPTPRSRESAIIMIADSIEAAYRSLDEMTEKAIIELVESIVMEKIRNHQLDTSHLTFDEIEAIKKAIIRALVAISHGRVKYPEKESSLAWKSEEAFV